MSAQHLKVIALGLLVLLLLWGGSELLSHGSDAVTGSLGLPVVSPDSVDTISVIKGADSIVLVKQAPSGWRVNGHRAAPDVARDVLQALNDTARPELVAQDPSSFARLGVDSVGGRWLSVRRGGKAPLALIVGGRGSDYQSAYARRPGDAHVYLWRGRLPALVDRAADDWRDKRIATLAMDSVTAVDVARGKDRYSLRRSGRVWTLNGGSIDSAAVARYLDRLKTITAAGFATAKAADSIKARAARSITVRGAGGVVLSLALDSTAAGFLVHHLAGVGGEGATVYRIDSWDADGITPTSRSLRPAQKK